MSKKNVKSSRILRALVSNIIEPLEQRALLSSTFITPHNLIQTDTLRASRSAITQKGADYWRPRSGDYSLTRTGGQTPSYINSKNYRAFALDTSLLDPIIDSASKIISIPRPDGSIQQFSFEQSQVMAPELAAQFPDIKTYSGRAIDGSGATIAFDQTPLGFHAQIIQSGKTYYIDPFYHLDQSLYASYWRSDMQKTNNFNCVVQNDAETAARGAIASDAITSTISTPIVNRTSGTQMRTYRLACAATGEYTAFFGGTVALGQAAIVTAVNRVNQVYESELSIHLTLVANNSSLVFTNASTDPYTNNDGNAMLSENQTRVDSVIGTANYDIGHVFSTGGGGVAYLQAVGNSSIKAGGVTGSPSPTGDAFWIDYVAHEMGHQFGGNHTFNTANDTGNRNASTAYEPGSGSTIMAYAGIEGADDLQPHSDPYFAWKNIDEITTFVDTTIPTVGTRVNTGNSIPTVSGGSNYSIPINTPFALTATGSDANGDTLYYSWEEADLGAANLLTAADNGSSPIFRVYNPTTSPTRLFPQLTSILSGLNYTAGPSSGKVEQLPTTARTMKFVITARDQRAGGGGINALSASPVSITSVLAANGFLITNMNSATQFTGGTTQIINWNVANTTAAPISTANVQILMSTDGGNTFPTVLAASTANDGSEVITLPNVASTQVRFKVAAIGNIYFDINNANITINSVTDTTAPTISSNAFNYLTSQSSTVVFSESVSPSITNTANYNIVNLTTGATVPTANYTSSFNTSNNTQTITYTSLLGNGNYRITYTGVTDTAGNPLTGTNTVDFFVLAGDANRDRHVDASDQSIVTTNLNTSSKNFSQGDFNYDGSVNSSDQTILTGNLNYWLPITGGLAVPSTISSDTITLTRVSTAQVSITYSTGTVYLLYTGGLTTMSFSGGNGNDSLTLDYSGGTPFSGTIFAMDGGPSTDTLSITGTSGVDTGVFGTNSITFAGTTISETTNEARTYKSNGGNDIVTVNGGLDLQLNNGATQSFGSITLNGGNAVVPANNFELVTKALSIAAANYLEVNNNNLLIDYTGGATPYSTIVTYVKNGTTALGGSGTGGIRSSYVNNNTISGTFLGVVDNASVGGAIPTSTKLPVVTAQSVIVRYTWFGDANLDGKVNGSDYALVDSGFISSASTWVLGNFDYSPTVNGSDYALIDTGFIQQNQVL